MDVSKYFLYRDRGYATRLTFTIWMATYLITILTTYVKNMQNFGIVQTSDSDLVTLSCIRMLIGITRSLLLYFVLAS